MSRRAGLRFVDKILFHFLRIEFYTNWEENEFMSKLLFANWKMNPVSEKEAIILARVGDVKHAVILPPFLFLPTVGKILKNAKFGVQNISWEKEGALTGEVSAEMVKKMGANYAIIGHSERREFLGESDEVIAAKVRTSLDAGLTPILCVGEPKSVRKKGFVAAKTYVKKQLLKNLSFTKNHKLKTINLIIAYEPIWAISTSGGGKETPEDAAEMIGFIRQQLKTSTQGGSTSGGKNHKLKTIYLLYGGSVNAKNVGDFLAMKQIDGALVGGASLHPSEFKKMVKIAESIK